MTTAIVFSKNRPAQLDLLLRSIQVNRVPVKTVVLWRSDNESFTKGYDACVAAHPGVSFLTEVRFKHQLEMLLAGAKTKTMLLCDDDVFYRRFEYTPFVLERPEVCCFSTRLGTNTTYCYPLNSEQPFPDHAVKAGSFYSWDWKKNILACDFGYPGSIDGTVFRTNQLLEILRGCDYTNPNRLEETIQQQMWFYHLPIMSCHETSCLVGMPINIVNDTHPNRNEGVDVTGINERWLKGEKIMLSTIIEEKVNAAHTPFELRWETK